MGGVRGDVSDIFRLVGDFPEYRSVVVHGASRPAIGI
jgi:hypothetical protein